ncbi:MAG: hypothetical protein GY749_22130, partial [Desulfobacteraceae bacterium]|nr:hypothetical protein [Desulfobacteraceae bacterium]
MVYNSVAVFCDTEFIKNNFKRLGPEYAVLLPLVKKEDIRDKTRELIDKHFNLTPSGKKQKRSYVLREDPLVRPAMETGPLERTGEESSEKQSSEKQDMVRLFF